MPSGGTKRAPRKRATRESGRAIVDAILSAAALLLERDGLEGLTTNALARIAGVSVGSVYQYYPNKLAIVAELARRLERTGSDFAAGQLEWMHEASVRDAAWRIAGLVTDPAFGSVRVRRTLLREVPRGWIHEVTKETDTTLEALLAGFLRLRREELRPAEPDRLAFVVYHAFDGVVEGAILLEPELLVRGELHEELFHLAWRYVAPDGASLAAPGIARSDGAPPGDASADAAARARLDTEPSRRRRIEGTASSTARGRGTRAAILAAAARVLAQDGLAGASARCIAREAGVAAGALYHHFRNVESVVSAIGLDEELRMRAAMADAALRLDELESRDAIESLVRIYAAPGDEARRRRAVLFREVPRRWAEQASAETSRAARRQLSAALGSRGDRVRAGDHERMAFVACRAVEGVVEAASLRGLHDAELDSLVPDLTELVWRYVRADPASG
jgi:AcrR family transcriptional regulator